MLRKILVILSVMGVITLLVLLPQQLASWVGGWAIIDGVGGYITAVLIAVITNVSLFIPVSNMMPLVVEIADHNTFWLVAGVYAAASAIAESTAYFAGRFTNKIPGFKESGVHRSLDRWMQAKLRTPVLFFLDKIPGFKQSSVYRFLERWMQARLSGPVLFFLALTPSPFDAGGMIAGNIGFPLKWFVLWTFIGRWLKYLWIIPSWGAVQRLIEEQMPWIGSASQTVMVIVLTIILLIVMRVALIAIVKSQWNGGNNSTQHKAD